MRESESLALAAEAPRQLPAVIPTPKEPRRTKVAAGFLALYLGGAGIHHLYLGSKYSSIVYILFSWTMLPWLFAIVEAIMFFQMDDAEFDAQYNRDYLVNRGC